MTRTRQALAAAIAAAGLLVSAACTGGGGDQSTPTPTPATSSSPTPTPKPTHKPKPKPKPPPKNPFTGFGPVPKLSTIAVKIDDTAAGRRQLSIDKADIVYIEAVEGGLTRLVAVFGTRHPRVGYVRSTRPSDPDLLLQFGKITEAYSGGAHDSLPRVHRSGIRSWSHDAGARFYTRVPHPGDHGYVNVVLNLWKVAHVVKTPRPKSIGWTFAWKLPHFHTTRGRHLHTEVTGSYRYGAGTPVDFRYAPGLHRYIRFINGVAQRAADGRLITARNVIVQKCKVRSHPRDTDVVGNPSQFTFTVGRGPVAVFRGGRRINGTWTRRHLKDGTLLRTYSGRRIPLLPGNTWVVLVRRGVPVIS
jgi:Protein of unknown function (DUF3048) N-terminal domain/Protein of unknown function (DUF3048) C-terminal domain